MLRLANLYLPFPIYETSVVEEPVNLQDDPDIRGTFKDFAGNLWAVGMQHQPELQTE